MSNTANRNLSREKIQQILASIGSQKEDDSNKVEAVEYNWHQPHYFSSAQLEKLNNFTEKVAQSCSEKFNQLYHSNFDVTIISTTQHFANEFVAADNAPNDYRDAVRYGLALAQAYVTENGGFPQRSGIYTQAKTVVNAGTGRPDGRAWNE